MTQSELPRTKLLSLLLVTVVALSATAGFAGLGAAATSTDLTVSITDDDNTLAPGETTTVEIAVSNADGGVGAAELGVELGSPGVATITDIETDSAPTLTDNAVASDGQSANAKYFGVDTADTGSVTFVEVTLETTSAGSTTVEVVQNSQTGNLVVFDENGAGYTLGEVGSATLTVEDENQDPTADAGDDQTVAEGATVQLDASGSSDDSSIESYSWSTDSDVTLNDASSATPTFTAPDVDTETTLTFEVEVTDDDGATDTDTIAVTVQPVDEEAPTISDFDVSAIGPDVDVSLTSDEQLATLSVDLGDDASGTLSLSDFTETDNGDGTFTYTADISEGSDGTFSATLQTAADAEDNDGATGQSDSVTVSPPTGDKEATVSLEPADQQTAVGTTVTYNVVVDNVDGGVGAGEVAVTVDDTSVATITDLDVTDVQDDAGNLDAEITDSSAQFDYYGVDTDDSGSVTIATVTVEGAGAGTASLSVGPTDDNSEVLLFDEGGTGYDVTGTEGATIDVQAVQFSVESTTAPEKAAVGSSVEVTATISSDGSVQSTQPVELLFDVDGDGTMESIETKSVTVDAGGQTQVSFTFDIPADTDFGERSYSVETVGDNAGGTVELTPPVVVGENLPGDPDDDGIYEDINGDGDLNTGDAQSLFSNRGSPAIQNNIAAFDFNGDNEVNAGDAQALFNEVIQN